MARERIISADSHVAIRDEAVLAYLPARHHEEYRRCRAEAAAQLAKKRKVKAGPRGEGPGTGNPSEQARWSAAGRPGEWDPVARLADMDLDGVEAEVLYCDVGAGTSFYGMQSGAREAAVRAFADATLDFAARDAKRLLPVYPVPLVDIDEAVREVQRLAAAGARALIVPLYPTDHGLAPYFDRRYERLWGAIQETGIPLSQHVNTNTRLWEVLASDPTPARGIFQSLPPLFMSESLATWIVSGTLARFPRLKVVFVEAGLGWIPFFLDRLDRMYVRHGWSQMDMLPEKPSFYWHRQMAATFEEDEFGVENRHRLGVDNLLWATDYPHPDSTWPESQKVLETHLRGVPVEEARQIIGGNAARLYGL
jgi:predicted TIM-barrel fold metal-dependent hydrolase